MKPIRMLNYSLAYYTFLENKTKQKKNLHLLSAKPRAGVAHCTAGLCPAVQGLAGLARMARPGLARAWQARVGFVIKKKNE